MGLSPFGTQRHCWHLVVCHRLPLLPSLNINDAIIIVCFVPLAAGVLSSVGVHTAPQFPFPPAAFYDKNITYTSGRCPARRIMTEHSIPLLTESPRLLPDVRELVITHRLPLDAAAEAYVMFDERRDGCTKVVFTFEE